MVLNIQYESTPANVPGKFDMRPLTSPFRNLQHSGQLVGQELIKKFGDLLNDAVIMGCARGGLYSGEAVVKEIRETTNYKVQLDTVIIRRVNLPTYVLNLENVGIGAFTEDGSSFIREDLKARWGRLYNVNFADPQIEKDMKVAMDLEGVELNERIKRYRWKDGEERTRPDLNGRVVIIYDDGVATGTTAMAAIRSIQNQFTPGRIILAVPMSPKAIMENVLRETGLSNDDVCVLECFEQKEGYRINTDLFYEKVDDVSHENVCEILDKEEKYWKDQALQS